MGTNTLHGMKRFFWLTMQRFVWADDHLVVIAQWQSNDGLNQMF